MPALEDRFQFFDPDETSLWAFLGGQFLAVLPFPLGASWVWVCCQPTQEALEQALAEAIAEAEPHDTPRKAVQAAWFRAHPERLPH